MIAEWINMFDCAVTIMQRKKEYRLSMKLYYLLQFTIYYNSVLIK